MILRDVGCLLKLISINKPLRTNAQVQVCLNGLLLVEFLLEGMGKGVLAL